MSFDLGIWHSSERLTPERAGKTYQALCRGDLSVVTPRGEVLQFYKHLTGKSPEIDAVPEEKLERSSFSSASGVSEGHVVLNLSWGSAPKMLPIVLRLAARYRLLCFDPQSDAVYMPGDPIPQPELPPSPKPLLAKINDQIARAFSRHGFKRTQRYLSKSNNGLRFEIPLENVSDTYAPAGLVRSIRIARWRRAHDEYAQVISDVIAGIFTNEPGHPVWKVEPSTNLTQTAAEIITFLQTKVLGYFARFDDVPALCAYLQEHDMPGMHPVDMIDFLLCFGSKEATERACRRVLATNAAVQGEFPVELEHYRRTRAFTRRPATATAEEMAKATHHSQISGKLGGLSCQWTQAIVQATLRYGLQLE